MATPSLQKLNDSKLSRSILAKIQFLCENLEEPVSFMHICGTHEYTITKNGLRSLLPTNLNVVSGPGCPVCVCPSQDINFAIEVSKLPNVILTSFGDMMRVPSNKTSLQAMKAQGRDIRVVYGPHDAIELAYKHPDKEIVFFAIGFETTAPLIAFELLEHPPPNFSIICAYKLVPPAMDYLINLPNLNIQGFLLPGHVSAIIGEQPYQQFFKKFPVPMVIGGFEVNDVLISIYRLISQVITDSPQVENTYSRIVAPEGNQTALSMIHQVFQPSDSFWRGLGMIPQSGYQLRKEFQHYDALQKFDIPILPQEDMPKGCSCDQVLIGKILPQECPLFATTCTPRNPIGPCMTSHEGSCQIAYQFRNLQLKKK